MRILAIASLYPLAADDYVGTHQHLNFRALVKRGHDIRVIRPQMRLYQWLSRDWRRKGGRIVPRRYELDQVPVECPRYWRLPGKKWRANEPDWRRRSLRALAKPWHAKQPFDLIYGCELTPDGVSAVELGSELGVPVMLSSIGSDAHTYPYQSERIMEQTRRVLRACDLILVEAEGAIADIRKLSSDTSPVHVFNRGIDLARYENAPTKSEKRRSLGLPQDRRLIIFVGAVNEGKGVRVLAEAFTKVHSRFQDADLVFMGTGPLEPWLREQAAAGGWSNRLHLLGRRPFTEVPQVLLACDVFCLPSFGEGLPKSVVEGMAAGLPVVVTRVGGVPDIMSRGESGLMIPPRDVEALSAAFSRLLANPIEAAKMGAQAREIAYRDFDTDRNATGILKFAEEAIARGKSRMARKKQPA